MNNSFRIVQWNANGLINHNQELQLFISTHKIDILLISETHFTDTSYFKINNFSMYCTNHPNNRSHGGSAILIRNNIKHYELPGFQYEHLQATSIVVEDWTGPLAISAIYCPPRHQITHLQFTNFFSTLGPRFICGGDYNAKNQMWGSRLDNPRGRQLFISINSNNMTTISSGEPTYWPTDPAKLPDLIDFFVTKGISANYLKAESSLDLHSDHSPIILTLSSSVIVKDSPPILCNKKTDWILFRNILDETINLSIPLKTTDDIDGAVEMFNLAIQNAAWKSTPTIPRKPINNTTYPLHIKQKIAEKRRLRRIWQNSRNRVDKTNLNRASHQLKQLLKQIKNEWFKDFSSSLSPLQDTNYSLWKVANSLNKPKTSIPPILKPDGSWAKTNEEKSEVFANFFHNVFQCNPGNNATDNDVLDYLKSPNQMSLPIKLFTPSEVKSVIMKELNPNKSPGYDLITGKILKELSRKGFVLLTIICNAILRLEYFPFQWKIANIIVIHKPGKPSHLVSSYRPISLLPTTSKVFEKLLLKRLHPLIQENDILPNHQFGFRQNHSTIEQVHRVVNVIKQSLEGGKYCSAAFLDIQQAFDKVWHAGLLFKIKSLLPHGYYNILKSYLEQRYFQIKFQGVYSSFYEIHSGVPQGSVLAPILYTIYTADLPVSPDVTLATFADDTALLVSHENPDTASRLLQSSLDDLSVWLTKWKIKANESKSNHVTFTLRTQICPPVSLNNTQLPQVSEVKYLGMHIDKRLTWRSHVWNKRLQLNTKFRKMHWLLNSKSHLSTENKLLLYKSILKPIWTYGLQLWGSTSKSNIDIIERFQSKTIRKIIQAPWYVTNEIILRDTKIPTVKEEISKTSNKYLTKLNNHPNFLAVNLLDNSEEIQRLKRHSVLELPYRF